MTLTIAMIYSLAGCTTLQGHELTNHLDESVGASINDFIDDFGPPTSTFTKPNGEVMYSWLWGKSGIYSIPVTQNGNTTYSVSSYENHCKMTMTTSPDGIIKNWRLTGNDCPSR